VFQVEVSFNRVRCDFSSGASATGAEAKPDPDALLDDVIEDMSDSYFQVKDKEDDNND
jgi:hypothetical protein